MSTKYNLASELLHQIFQLVPPDAQNTCQSVCKSWHPVAKKVYFSQVHLTQRTDPSKLMLILKTSGHLVQSLTINTNNILTFQGFSCLVKYCPLLSELDLYHTYFKWLWLDSSIVPKRIKVISINGDASFETHKYFYYAAHRFCHSIEKIYIRYATHLVLQREYGGIIQYLSQFENLKSLRLADVIRGSRSIPAYFDNVLTACQKLEKLDIEFGHSLYAPSTAVVSGNQTTRTPYYPSMRRLKINFTKFSTGYLQYIMDRFIKLIQLEVHIYQHDIDREEDKQEVCYFVRRKFIPFIKSLSRSSLIINMKDPSIISDLSAEFFTTFSELKIVRFLLDEGISERTGIQLEIEQGSKNLSFTFVRNISLHPITELPYVNHLKTYGHHIKSLEIDRPELLDFNFIMDSCRNLERLRLGTDRGPTLRYTSIVKINKLITPCVSYRKLIDITIIGGMMIAPNIIDFLSSHVPNLKKLHILNFILELESKEDTCSLDLSKFNFLDVFVLDAEQMNQKFCLYTCFKIIVFNNRIEYYLTRNYGSGLKKLLSHEEIPTKTFIITLIFNDLTKVELHKGGRNYSIT
ncbi:hypothetical protein EDC94DRAFT_686287 [Helicostylum pulchrum]|nr:hypothetical protein EDC94DRAFT_686287 [Helicostylum pulchrum]